MDITFDCGSVYTSFVFHNLSTRDKSKAIAAIRSVTSAQPAGYAFMPSFRAKTWDGYIHLCKLNRFPTGLLLLALNAVNAIGFQTETHLTAIDNIDLSVIHPNMFSDIVLRKYQVDSARLLLHSGRGVAKMATNSGKTEVMAAMAKTMAGRVLILTTKKDLLYQTAERLSLRLGEEIGLVGDGTWNESNRVTVGMIQTLALHQDNMQRDFVDVSCVMFDECHHVSSKTSQQVMYGLPASFRFGFSGTPLKHDKLADLVLIGATGPVIVDVTNMDLIQQGISARPIVHMHTVESDNHYDAMWRDAYKFCIVHNAERNQLIRSLVQEKAEAGASVLVLVDRLEHGEILLDLIDSSAFVSAFVHGSLDMSMRRSALDALRDSKGNGYVVIATPIFDEGVDVPAVNVLVLAGGGKGHVKLLQRLGRGMRRKEEDNTLYVIDFLDDTNDYLLRHSLARAEVYEAEGFDVVVIGNAQT